VVRTPGIRNKQESTPTTVRFSVAASSAEDNGDKKQALGKLVTHTDTKRGRKKYLDLSGQNVGQETEDQNRTDTVETRNRPLSV
jgi:hypothetical protein